VKAGVKSTALLFGRHVKKFLAVFAGIMVACLAAAGVLNGQGVLYFTVAVGGAAFYFISQLQNLDVDDPNSCLSAVRSPKSSLSTAFAESKTVRIECFQSG
jgi:4-hydroxybenzoate polyprenyltransferase